MVLIAYYLVFSLFCCACLVAIMRWENGGSRHDDATE